MTFGNQNTESESHSQLDYAVENGINFIDTAEMYPIGGNAQIVGSTERHIGSWISKIGYIGSPNVAVSKHPPLE